MNSQRPSSRLTWMNANQAFSNYFCQVSAHTCREISNLAKNSRTYTLLAQWSYPSAIIPSREPARIATTPCTSPGQNTTKNRITLTQDLFQAICTLRHATHYICLEMKEKVVQKSGISF